MSDDFIPFNQSTPKQNWNQSHENRKSFQHNRQQHHRAYRNKWGNNSQAGNSNFGSDNNSFRQDNKNNIDVYLHPSMLQDPWLQLRKNTT